MCQCERGRSSVVLGFMEHNKFQFILYLSGPVNFTALVHSHLSHSIVFGWQQAAVLSEKFYNFTVHHLLSTKRQTDAIGDKLLNTDSTWKSLYDNIVMSNNL